MFLLHFPQESELEQLANAIGCEFAVFNITKPSSSTVFGSNKAFPNRGYLLRMENAFLPMHFISARFARYIASQRVCNIARIMCFLSQILIPAVPCFRFSA